MTAHVYQLIYEHDFTFLFYVFSTENNAVLVENAKSFTFQAIGNATISTDSFFLFRLAFNSLDWKKSSYKIYFYLMLLKNLPWIYQLVIISL